MKRFANYFTFAPYMQGWFQPACIRALVAIDRLQKTHGVTGNILEIGVHQGKSLAAFALLADDDKGETVHGLDINDEHFGIVHQNCDCAGVWPAASLRKSNTLEMEPNDFQYLADLRLIHIDGDHTRDGCFKDLINTATWATSQTVIVVDDVFNPKWPAVSEGVHDFMAATIWRPFAIGWNKAFFALEAFGNQCFERFAKTLGWAKRTTWKDSDVLCY